MKILEIYILRRAFQMFLVTLLPVLTIIWTIQVLGRINLVTDTGQSDPARSRRWRPSSCQQSYRWFCRLRW